MKTQTLRRTGMCVATLAALASALTVVFPGPAVTLAVAAVHIGLASSVPAKDSHVTAAPREIRLTFSGPIDVTRAKVQLLGADGQPLAVEPLRAVPDSVRVAVSKVTGNVAAGTYTVRWEAIASDGAPGSGAFSFMYVPAGGSH